MKSRKGWLVKLVSMPVLAVCGFVAAATLAGVSLAGEISSTTTTVPTTTTTTTVPTSTTTTTTPTTTTTTTTTTGAEGCTLGYWKNHPQSWVGYTTNQTIGSVFSKAPPSVASLTLLQGLQLGGGGVNALTRQAIAALLNAASPNVDYPLTTSQVIDMVNAAYASGDAATIESLKDTLDGFNSLGAPGFCG